MKRSRTSGSAAIQTYAHRMTCEKQTAERNGRVRCRAERVENHENWPHISASQNVMNEKILSMLFERLNGLLMAMWRERKTVAVRKVKKDQCIYIRYMQRRTNDDDACGQLMTIQSVKGKTTTGKKMNEIKLKQRMQCVCGHVEIYSVRGSERPRPCSTGRNEHIVCAIVWNMCACVCVCVASLLMPHVAHFSFSFHFFCRTFFVLFWVPKMYRATTRCHRFSAIKCWTTWRRRQNMQPEELALSTVTNERLYARKIWIKHWLFTNSSEAANARTAKMK